MPPSPWLLNDETLWFNHLEALGNPNAYMHVHTIIMMNEHVRLNHIGGPAGSMKGGRQIEVAKEILSAKNVPYMIAAPLLIQSASFKYFYRLNSRNLSYDSFSVLFLSV